jgi:hypothetical protein
VNADPHRAAAAPSALASPAGPTSRGGVVAAALLLAVYAAGLSRDINEPWNGLHDWNGAFYSQLSRNFLRYPWSAHHGLPLVAVGEVAPPRQRSIYPTHPPGLVWILAIPFALVGESEWIARATAIAASLLAMALLMAAVARSRGWPLALLTGFAYAILPMTVYYGRMVNHEPYCLALMLAGAAAWDSLLRSGGRSIPALGTVSKLVEPANRRFAPAIGRCHNGIFTTHTGVLRWSLAAWAAATVACIWIDWPGVIFAALCGVDALRRYRNGQLRGVQPVAAFAGVGIAAVGLLAYLVYAGMGGRWGDLWAVFTARSGAEAPQGAATGWQQTAENLTIPVAALILLGAIACLCEGWRRRLSRPADRDTVTASQPKWNRRRNHPVWHWLIASAGPAIISRSHTCDERPHRMNHLSAQTSLWIVHATGMIWIAVFWRQYRIHGYWAFYLGPAAALLCAIGLQQVRTALSGRRRGLGRFALVAVLALLLVFAAPGAADLFDRAQVPIEWIDAWKAARLAPNASLEQFMPPNPIQDERWGRTVFRNIVPPQLAYYLDRLPASDWGEHSDPDH